jgi:hypothetical protein
MKSLREDQIALDKDIAVFERRIANAPFVEKELNALNRDYENSQRKYADISNKLMNAQVAKEMEGKQRGERFTVTSAAYLPMKPYKPNRLAIILLSFLVAIGISSVLVVMQESIDDSIKSSDQLRTLTGVPVLTSISYIVTDQEIKSKRLKRIGWFFVASLFIGAGLIGVNQYVIKLTEIWSIVLERIMMIA